MDNFNQAPAHHLGLADERAFRSVITAKKRCRSEASSCLVPPEQLTELRPFGCKGSSTFNAMLQRLGVGRLQDQLQVSPKQTTKRVSSSDGRICVTYLIRQLKPLNSKQLCITSIDNAKAERTTSCGMTGYIGQTTGLPGPVMKAHGSSRY
jgi:hypothetical protein